MITKFNDYITESNNILNEEFVIFKSKNGSVEYDGDINNTSDVIKDKVYEYLKITKDKINDPENIKKINTFLDEIESVSKNISITLKKDRNLKISENLLGLGKWISLITGIYQLIFESSASIFSGIEIGGITALKFALFFYITKLIVTIFRRVRNFKVLVQDAKSVVNGIINLFKKNNDEVTENYKMLIFEYIDM